MSDNQKLKQQKIMICLHTYSYRNTH